MVASAAFWSNWGWAAATAVLGFVFFGLVFWQYLQRRRMHQLAWAIGLFLYALAAAMEAYSESSGTWHPFIYRIYIVIAASLVGFLGLGTLYLVARRRRWGDYYFVFLVACMVVFFFGTFTTTLDMTKLVPGITVGGQALGESLSFPRFMSLPINITGTLLLFGGALWSIIRFIGKREYGYRVWANVLIAAGAAVLADAGLAGAAGRHDRALPGRDGGRGAHARRVPPGRHARQGHGEAQGAARGRGWSGDRAGAVPEGRVVLRRGAGG